MPFPDLSRKTPNNPEYGYHTLPAYYEYIYIIGRGHTPLACALHLLELGTHPVLLEDAEEHPFASITPKRPTALQHAPLSALDALRDTRARTLVLSVNNIRIFKKETLANENVDIFNYHNALLPYHRGVNAEAWSIFHEDPLTGVTWHKVDAGIDTGRIAAQKEIALDDEITSIQLLKRQSQAALQLFKDIVPAILENRIELTPQPAIPVNSIHYACDRPNDGVLNPDWPAHRIWAFLRAMDYGKLTPLGIPRIGINGQCLRWKRYCRNTPDAPEMDGERIIRLKGGITLHNCRPFTP